MKKLFLSLFFLLITNLCYSADYRWANTSELDYQRNSTHWWLNSTGKFDRDKDTQGYNLTNATTVNATNIYQSGNRTLDVSNVTQFLSSTHGNWKVFYSNDTGVFTELALGASGYLKTNGATSAPTWDTPAGGTTAFYNGTAAVGNNTGLNITAGSGITVVATNTSTATVYTIASSASGGNASINDTAADYLLASDGGGYIKNSTYATTDAANWNTAYGWGDHALGGYSISDQGTNTTDDPQFNNLTINNLFGVNDATVNMWGDFSVHDAGTFWLWYNDTLATGWLTPAPNVTQLQIKDSWHVRFNLSDITADTELHFQTKNGTIALLDDVNVTADDDDSTKGVATFNNTDFDVVGGLVTIAPDAIDSAHISNYTVDDHDIKNTSLTDLKRKEFNIPLITILEPDLITNATGLQARSAKIFLNTDTRTYLISEIVSTTDVDNYNFSIYKSVNFTNCTLAGATYIGNITIADNGEGQFYNNTTGAMLSNLSVETGKWLIFIDQEDINVTYMTLTIRGNFS